MAPLLNIGPSPTAIREARNSLLAILECGAEQETLREALKTFRVACSCDGAVISNCSFYGEPPKKKKRPK